MDYNILNKYKIGNLLKKHNKMINIKCANSKNFSVIRILQEDVFYDTYDWITELVDSIEKIKIDNTVQNIYMCKNNEYDKFNNP
jgi:hypothetical protein